MHTPSANVSGTRYSETIRIKVENRIAVPLKDVEFGAGRRGLAHTSYSEYRGWMDSVNAGFCDLSAGFSDLAVH